MKQRQHTQWKTGILNIHIRNNINYYVAKPVLGKSEHYDWFFLGWNFALRTIMVMSYFFLANFSKAKEQSANHCCKGKMIEKINLTEV